MKCKALVTYRTKNPFCRSRQCRRDAIGDSPYCSSHQPEAVAARKEKQQARKREKFERNQKWQNDFFQWRLKEKAKRKATRKARVSK